MKSTKEPELVGRARGAFAQSDLARRWTVLKQRSAPVLGPRSLALALTLGASLAASAFFQFATGLYEARPDWSIASSLINATLATGFGISLVVQGRWRRPQIALVGAATAVALLSLVCMGGKIEYRRGLAGNPFYSLPHQPMRYPATATDVWLRTSDGVRLQGTLLNRHHPRAVVIYPSWRTNRDAFSIATLATWLSASYDVLVLDPRGQGGSGGAKSPMGDDKYDVLAAVAFLRASGHERVGVLAEQEGAYPALLAAGMHQGIDSLALIAPSARWGESLGHDGGLWDPKGFLGRLYWRATAGLRLGGGLEGQNATEAVRLVSPTPLMLCGPRNNPGGALDQWHLAAAEPKSLMLVGGEGSPTDWAHFAEYYQTLEQWLKLSLRSL